MIKKNDIVKIQIEDMTNEGSGVGRFEGMAIFVPMTAPGDTVNVKIVKLAKNYAFGIIDSIEIPSEERTEPDCPVFAKCGGCVYRHISYEAELKIKENRVKNAISRIGGFPDLKILPIAHGETRTRYRNKSQIPVGLDKDGKLIMGFYGTHSHRIVNNDNCLLQPEDFGAVTEVFRDWFENYGDTVYNEETHKGVIRHLYIRYGEKTGELMVCVVINGKELKNADKLAALMRDNIPDLKSLVLNENTEKTNVILGKKCRTLIGSDYIEDELCGLKFRLSPLSFYQVNRSMAERLYEQAAEYAGLTGNEYLLDLYCGTGTIGLSMAYKARKLTGVEIIPQAIENAKENAKQNGIENAEFICGDAAKAAALLAERQEKPDVIILDPPRKGCDSELIKTVVAMNPQRIVYVSCDPATLARDMKLLNELGYCPKEARPFDLFPATSHCETVCILSRHTEN